MALRPRRATPEEEKDIELMEQTGMIGLSMSHYMMWRMQAEHREEHDGKPIGRDVTLDMLLGKTPIQMLEGIVAALNIPLKGRKPEKLKRVSAQLQNPARLREIVGAMPVDARLVLKTVLEHEGVVPLAALEKDFGETGGDGWFWVEHPPTSLIGQARLRGLVFVGKMRVGKKNSQIALIPPDVRDAVNAALADTLSAAECERTATTRAIEQFGKHLGSLAGRKSKVDREDAFEFICSVPVAHALNLADDLIDLELYLARIRLKTLDELAGHHLSEWVNYHINFLYIGELPLEHKRRLLETTARYVEFLAARGRIARSTAERVRETVQQIKTQKGGPGVIDRPPPLGGELVVTAHDKRGKPLTFTMNDRWLLISALGGFRGNWEACYAQAETVADGAKKQAMLKRLAPFAENQNLLGALLEGVTEDEVAFAQEWFFNEPVSELSAW